MPRSLLVVNYPTISPEDLAWIQNVRHQHDSLYFQVVLPHFTLVFPVFGISEEILIAHVRQVTQQVKSFDFVLRCAVLGDDAFSEYTHIFLVPDEGYSNLIKLHDRLYTGVLARELRLDLPFIPHIGIANSLDVRGCKQVADNLNIQNFEIGGRVENLDVIWHEKERVGTIEQIILL